MPDQCSISPSESNPRVAIAATSRRGTFRYSRERSISLARSSASAESRVEQGHEPAAGALLQIHGGGVNPHVIEPGSSVKGNQGRQQRLIAPGERQPDDTSPEYARRGYQELAAVQPVGDPPEKGHGQDRSRRPDEEGEPQRAGRETERATQIRQQDREGPPEEPEEAESEEQQDEEPRPGLPSHRAPAHRLASSSEATTLRRSPAPGG